MLRPGSIFPDFDAETTLGPVRLGEWAKGSWTFLFIHPLAATPVCTSELVSILKHEERFAALNTKVLGINSSPLDDQKGWHHDCERVFGRKVWFPCLAALAPMFPAALGTQTMHGRQVPGRKTVVLDPQRRVRLVLDYPLNIGRNVREVLRCIEAMQIADRCDVMVPADWRSGDALVTASRGAGVDADSDIEVTVLPYLTIISDPDARAKPFDERLQ